MRAGAHALLPIFLAGVAFVLISSLWRGGDSSEFANAAVRRATRPRAAPVHAEQNPEPGLGSQIFLRGQLVDAQSGEPVATQVTLFGARGTERHAEAGADGMFQIGCGTAGLVTLAIPRSLDHFGLFQEFQLSRRMPAQSLKLAPRLDLPVILRTPDGRALSEAAPPSGPWARETWPSILVTQAPPGGTSSEGGADPLLATRVGDFLSSVHGDVPLRPGSPERCVGYLRLLQAPPVYCSLVIGSRVLQTIKLEADDRLLSFTVDPSELHDAYADVELRVIEEATGRPPDAHHGLWLGMLGGSAREVAADLDEDGYLKLEGVPAGSVELHLRLNGYEHAQFRFDLRPGRLNDLGLLRLNAGACVTGHLVDQAGEPVSAHVWSSTLDGREHPAGQAADSPAGADWFAVLGLPRTSVLVGIDDPRFALNPIEVDLGGGSVQNARIVAREGALLRLVGPYSAAGTASLRVLDARRLCVWSGDNLEEEVHELRLLPGRYTIEITREGTPVTRQEVDLGSAPDATIRLR